MSNPVVQLFVQNLEKIDYKSNSKPIPIPINPPEELT